MIEYAFFLLGLVLAEICLFFKKGISAVLFFLISITISGIFLNFYGELNLLFWIPLSIIIFYVLGKTIKLRDIEIDPKIIVIAAIIVFLFSWISFTQGLHGPDFEFYREYAYLTAIDGKAPTEIVNLDAKSGISDYTSIKIPPFFNLFNAFAIQAGANNLNALFFILSFLPILFIAVLLHLGQKNGVNILLMGLLICLDYFITYFIPMFSREIPLLLFSTMFYLFFLENKIMYAWLAAIMAVFTKITGIFFIAILLLFSKLWFLLPLLVFWPGIIDKIKDFLSTDFLTEINAGILLTFKLGGWLHFLAFPAISFIEERKFFILSIIVLLAHVFILIYPTGTLRYSAFLYPLELLIVGVMIQKSWEWGTKWVKNWKLGFQSA